MPRRKKLESSLVPIVADRLRAAMHYAGLNSRTLYARITKGASTKRRGGKRPTGAVIDQILSGDTKNTHRDRRDAIARACGRPITSAFLGGEEDLPIPPLLWPPSGRLADHMPGGPRQLSKATPQSELEALRLGGAFAEKAAQDRSFVPTLHPGPPKMDNATRWMLSLAFWREFINRNQEHGSVGASFRTEADAFASHMASALAILFRPWLAGRAALRPKMLYRLLNMLDAVAAENVEMVMALERGAASDIAILDELGFWKPSLRDQLRSAWEKVRDDERKKGTLEPEIADLLTRRIAPSDNGDDDKPIVVVRS